MTRLGQGLGIVRRGRLIAGSNLRITSSPTFTIPESTRIIGTITANKASVFACVGGVDQAMVNIAPLSGIATLVEDYDFESPVHQNNKLNIIVRATSGSESVDQNIEITITNVEEPGLETMHSLMAFRSGAFDWDLGKWLDQSGSDNHASLVDSFCCSFNGTTSKITYNYALIAAAAHIRIAAKPTSGSWTWYTELTAPAGLYNITGSLLTLGNSGATFFSGLISGFQLLDADNIVIDEQYLSEGYSQTNLNVVVGKFTKGATQYITNFGGEGQTELVDDNSDGIINGWTLTGSGTASIVNAANGFAKKAQRVDVIAGGTNPYLEFQTNITQELSQGVYIKFKYRSSKSLNVHSGSSTKYYPYSARALNTGNAIENIVAGQFYLNPGMYKVRIQLSSSVEGDWFEVSELEVWNADGRSGYYTAITWNQTAELGQGNLKLGFDIWNQTSGGYKHRIHCNIDGSSRCGYGDERMAGYTWLQKVPAVAAGYSDQVETKVQFPAALEAYDSGNLMFDASHVAKKLTYLDFMFRNKADRIFSGYNYKGAAVVKDFCVFREALTSENLNTVTNIYNANVNEMTLLLAADNNNYYVRKAYDSINDMVINVQKLLPAAVNPITQFYQAKLIPRTTPDYNLIAAWPTATLIGGITGDEIAPFFTNWAIIGGDHPMTVAKVTAVLSLDNSDIGSVWSKSGASTHKFKYCGKNGSDFIFLRMPIPDNPTDGDFLPSTLASGDTLIHASGAIHTDNLVCTTVASEENASNRSLSQTVLTNKGSITVGGVKKCNEITFYDEHYVVNPATLIPSEYPNFNTNERWFTVANIYTFKRNGSLDIVSNNTLHLATTFATYYGAGAQTYLANQNSAYRFVPKTKSYNYGYGAQDISLKTLVSALKANGNYIVTEGALLNANDPADRVCDIYTTGGLYSVVGFFKEYGQGANRLTEIGNSAVGYLLLAGIGKVYPRAFIGNHGIGTLTTNYMYRDLGNSARSDSATTVYYVSRGNQWYMFIDYHTSVTNEKIEIPGFLAGKTFTVLEKHDNVTVNTSGELTVSNGLNLTVTSNYGFLVLKLSN